MPSSTTIYSDWGWDEVFSSAVLAIALSRKGYKVFIEFPTPLERRGLVISRSYSVGITHRDGATLINSLALEYINDRKLGLVIKYNGEGKSEILMRFANASSLTEVTMEYVSTMNERVDVPQQILNDIVAMNNMRLDKLSRVGRIMYRALKMNYSNKEFRNLMYSFAISVITTKSLKIPDSLAREASKYDIAMDLGNKLIKNRHYIDLNGVKVITVSSKFNDDFIKKNITLLKSVAYDILVKTCRSDGFAILIQETELGHTMRVCLLRRDVSFINVIKSIPPELSQRLLITLRGNHIIIKFKNPSESSLDAMLDIATKIVSAVATRK